jgi:hypothetical protein
MSGSDKQLYDAAFEAADKYCDCNETDPCMAGAFTEGFVAGAKFEKHRRDIKVTSLMEKLLAWGRK